MELLRARSLGALPDGATRAGRVDGVGEDTRPVGPFAVRVGCAPAYRQDVADVSRAVRAEATTVLEHRYGLTTATVVNVSEEQP